MNLNHQKFEQKYFYYLNLYLDTNKIKVDLNPNYVRLDINGKITQWRFDHDIIVEKATVQRATTTGVLEIKAPIVGFKPR